MPKRISKLEQRCDAVTMVIRDGFSIADIAVKFKVSCQSVHRWLAKYEEGGLEVLADESRRPLHFPHQMEETIETAFLEM